MQAHDLARKLYRGLKGEKPGLMAVRNGQSQALSLLLERGAACDPELVLGVALFAERSAKAGEPTAMADAQKMIAIFDSSPMPKNRINTGNNASACAPRA